ncbi:MAG: hypothetical protein F2786_03550 [Actinobacteria bacterium]|uniref:Unannotated protein n=1 Tax=freshwater metagenome TaxID=449393 RepID=A0A6J7D6B6_9ZZZZ|nr:hypothetical protein [Actinomycetota bacterium]
MKSKSTSSAPEEVIKDARKQGRRDGKNQIPRQEWEHNSVPYLMQLQRQYAAFGRELDLQLEEKKLAKESQKVSAIRTEIQEKGKSNALAGNLARAEAELAVVQAKLDGGVEEVPLAKFARIRLISNTFYLPFLFLLFIGEFTITAPAFRILLGEKVGPSLIVTLAVSGLSVGAAHILGIYFKSLFDRNRPKSGVYNAMFAVVGVLLIGTITFLSNIRGRNSVLTSGNLTGMSENGKIFYLWAFYTLLQLTFVGVGIAISFMHYSEIESAVARAKRKVWFLRYLQNRRNSAKLKSGASIEESDIDTSKMHDRELEVMESKKILLRAQYEEAVAVYRDANIQSRRDEMSGAHASLQASELDFRTSGLEFSTSELVGAR